MATTSLLTVDQYLKMHFEDREPEFARGQLIERSMPTFLHGRLQHLLSVYLHGAGLCASEVRMRLASDVIRIPDLAVFHGVPQERVPATAPFLVVEITSPDDRWEEMLRKLDEYRDWGVEHIWVVEPEMKKFHVYDSRGLSEVRQFELADLRITADALFAEAIAP
jgi:Uma2 family endonuclease